MTAVQWIEQRSGLALRPWQRAVVEAMFPADGKPSQWETFLISTVKKAGKTTLSAWCALYAALMFGAGETAFVIGNDLEQGDENVFALLVAAVRQAGLERSGAAVIRSDRIVFDNGTRIIALASDFAGSAGARFGITLWTEVWAFRHEGHVRLWEELTPIPHRRSLRIVDSYAGFDGDAPVLEPLWKRALAGERLREDLPIYANGRLWAYLDQGVEAQTRGWLGDLSEMDDYYVEQSASLRSGTFARLHLNQWQAGEEAFVTAEKFDACVVPGLHPAPSNPALEVYVGADAATRRDCAAVVAVAVVETGGRVSYRIVRHRIWTQRRGVTLDLEETLEAYLLELAQAFRVVEVRYDPYQFVRSAQTLEKRGVRMVAYNQTAANLTQAGQTLYDLVNTQQIEFYEDEELRRHFLNAVAVYSSRGWRLAKEKTSNKIDGCVATSFAALGAVATVAPSFDLSGLLEELDRCPVDPLLASLDGAGPEARGLARGPGLWKGARNGLLFFDEVVDREAVVDELISPGSSDPLGRPT